MFVGVVMDQSGTQYRDTVPNRDRDTIRFMMQTMLLILLPSGFGNYLASIDPQNRLWYNYLKHNLVLCRVHFKRKIEDRMGKFWSEYGVEYRMMALTDFQSREEYMQLVNILKNFEADKRVRTWVQNKTNPVIVAAINRNCRRQRLLPAIEKSRILDRRYCDQAKARLVYGIMHTYRNPAMSSRYAEVFTRERRERLALEERINQASIESQDDNLDYQVFLDVDHVPEHDLQHNRVAAQYFGGSTKRARRGSSPRTRSTSRSASRSASQTRPSPIHRAASQNVLRVTTVGVFSAYADLHSSQSPASFFTAANTRAFAAQTIEDEDIIFARE
ncbi:hypothetical protein GcM1_221007 [Golovinomyces cichoracearum]|uniref:Uncharacterized protein n=1 Tax=Golovinomyces cichoracearum TaxID=62708 RepID=A0A420IRG0_9PEZI|nr:hypothetical protein GcM1_221007 [Golovinomyces cichoracearum]